MVDSKPTEEECQGARTRDAGAKTHRGPTEPVLQTQKTHSPSPPFIKENINVLRTMIKEHDQKAKMKVTPRKLAYADFDKEAPVRSLAREFSDRFFLESFGTSDTRRQAHSASKSQRTPSKNKEPTHLRRSRRLEDRSITKEKTKRERSKSRRKRFGHQETSSDSEHEEGSEDAYEDLDLPYKRPKRTPFTQRITRFKYHMRAKIPRNIRVYEGNKDPKDHLGIFSAAAEQEEWPMPIWCKMFCQTLGGVTQNWFDDLDPKSVDNFKELNKNFLEEFLKQKRAFIRGEMVAGSAEMVRPSQGDKGGTVASRKLARLVKDIRQTNKRNGSQERNNVKVINMIREEGSHKRPFEEGRFFGRNISSLRVIYLRVTMGKEGRSKTVLMEFAIIKCCSPYNIIIGRTGMRSLRAVGSTIHSMIKFPTNQGVVTMETSREVIRECKHLERVQCMWKEIEWHQHEEKMSRIREQVILRTKNNSGRGPDSSPVSPEKTLAREDVEEVFTISHKRPDQYVTIGATLITNCKQLLADVLKKNKEVFAWDRPEKTTVPQFFIEHQLKIYPFVELMAHKRRPMASEERLSLKENVDYYSLKKVCTRDMYPFPEEGGELKSLMGASSASFVQRDPSVGLNLTRTNANGGQGNNFNRGNNFHGNQSFQVPNQRFQNQPFQVPNNQVQQGFSTEFSNYKKANDQMMRNMQSQINSLKGELKNEIQNTMKAQQTVLMEQKNAFQNNFQNMLSGFFQNQSSTSGTLSSNSIPNPKGEMKAITTRSEPDIPKSLPKPNIPYPSRLNDQKLRKKATNQIEKFFQIFQDFHFDISFADALLLMPKFASTIKSLLANKDKLFELAKIPTPTRMTLELANRSITRPKGVDEDVFIKVGKFHFPTDFVVVDFETDPQGDICLIEKLLNDDPFQLLSMDLKQGEVVRVQPSIEEPLELELRDLPSHFEYAYVEGVDKLHVIIAKDLKVDEKGALLKVLKSHK
nr:reverse transcriptase domain-containing protein [Tanacetum cinerariifolium]